MLKVDLDGRYEPVTRQTLAPFPGILATDDCVILLTGIMEPPSLSGFNGANREVMGVAMAQAPDDDDVDRADRDIEAHERRRREEHHQEGEHTE